MNTADKNIALRTMAIALLDATCVGSPAPVVRRIGEWMRATPQRGDLVIETSTMYRSDRECLGIFISQEDLELCEHQREDPNMGKCAPCDEADAKRSTATDEDDGGVFRYRDRYTWVERLDPPCGKEQCDDVGCVHRFRWYNAAFVRLPATRGQFAKATRETP